MIILSCTLLKKRDMAAVHCICVLVHLIVLVTAIENETFSDKFLIKTNLTESEVRILAAKNGFQLHKKVFVFCPDPKIRSHIKCLNEKNVFNIKYHC